MSLHTTKLAALALLGLSLSLSSASALDRLVTVAPTNIPDFPIEVSNPMPVDVPRPHIDPQSAPKLVHVPNSDDLNDAFLGKGKTSGKIVKANAPAGLGLDCSIDAGDLLLVNLGDDIVAGAKVKWRADGNKGAIGLPHGLLAGQQARINDAVALSGGNCSAEVI